MNEKPILFSGEMVRAILDGRKKMTRRVVKGLPQITSDRVDMGKTGGLCFVGGHLVNVPYQAGQRLWVRETWADPTNNRIAVYRADGATAFQGMKWKPSIFMPRWACRLELVVTAVRVERLQDISDKDAVKEGCFNQSKLSPKEDYSFRGGFRALWDSLNEKRGYGWDSNPWVWVVEFEKVQP